MYIRHVWYWPGAPDSGGAEVFRINRIYSKAGSYSHEGCLDSAPWTENNPHSIAAIACSAPQHCGDEQSFFLQCLRW